MQVLSVTGKLSQHPRFNMLEMTMVLNHNDDFCDMIFPNISLSVFSQYKRSP